MESEIKSEELPQKNVSSMTRWHFLILIGISSGTILDGLIPHSFGTLIADFRSRANSTLKITRSDISFVSASQFQLNWLPALSSALPCIFLPLFSYFIKRINRYCQIISITSFLFVSCSCAVSSLVSEWRLMFLTYSMFYSIGTSAFLAVVVNIVADYFPFNHQFHVLATSLYQIGYPTAAFIGNPTLAALIVLRGWRNAFRLISLIQLTLGVIIGVIMKPDNQGFFCNKNIQENESTSDASDNDVYSVYDIMKRPQFWPWLIGKYLNYMFWYGLRTNIVTYLVRSTTFGLERSARLMSAYAAAEIVIAILASLLSDRCLRGRLIHVHIAAAASMTILTSIYNMTLTSYASAIVMMLCIGIAVQCSLSFGYPASIEVLSSEFNMTSGWIVTNVAAGLGILSSPILSGLLMDQFNLTALFYAQAVGWGLQTICYSITLVILTVNRGSTKRYYKEL